MPPGSRTARFSAGLHSATRGCPGSSGRQCSNPRLILSTRRFVMWMSRSIFALTGCAALSAPALASDLVVGGPQGVTYRGDAVTGGFQFFGTCGGPIQSMAQLGEHLYLGDESGNVYRENIFTGQLEDMFRV